MARTVVLSTLRSRVRQRANLEGALLFIPDAELNDVINESWTELYDLLVAAYGEDYFLTSTTITTSSSTDTYALPSTFYQLRGIDITIGVNVVLTAQPFMWAERNTYKYLPGWVYNQPIRYRIEGGNIIFIPIPSGVYTVKVWFVPVFTTIGDDNTPFDGINGWEEYAVLDAAIKCLIKDGDTEGIANLTQRKMEIRQRLEAMAVARDGAFPERVQDTSREGYWDL